MAKYKELITKSEEAEQVELVELEVSQAQNTLEQGILSVKSKLIGAESEAKTAKNAVVTATRKLEAAKATKPFNVQSILNARTAVTQAELDVTTANETYNEIKETFDYLTALSVELF